MEVVLKVDVTETILGVTVVVVVTVDVVVFVAVTRGAVFVTVDPVDDLMLVLTTCTYSTHSTRVGYSFGWTSDPEGPALIVQPPPRSTISLFLGLGEELKPSDARTDDSGMNPEEVGIVEVGEEVKVVVEVAVEVAVTVTSDVEVAKMVVVVSIWLVLNGSAEDHGCNSWL